MGFIVPFVAILGALYLAKYVFKDMPILKKLNPRNASAKGKKQKTMPQEQQEGPTDFNNPQPQN